MFEDFGPRDRSLRAADADREAVAETLREQHLAGRLDTEELQERIGRCYTAKTYAELDGVLVDLPRPRPRPRTRPRQRGSAAPWPRAVLFPLMPLLIVALVLSHGHLLWLAVPLVFWFLVRPLRFA